MRKQSPREKCFVHEYLIDLNATKAAERAGFSKKTARQLGARLLSKVHIQKAIADAMKRREARTEITQDQVLRELALIGFSDLKNYLEINPDTGAIRAKGFEDMPKDASRALESITEDRTIKEDAKGDQVTVYDKVKFKLHDKLGALELLGKHLNMFKSGEPPAPAVSVVFLMPRPGRPEDKE